MTADSSYTTSFEIRPSEIICGRGETRSAKVARSTLQQALDRFAARQAVEAPSIVLSPEEIERLEALGYLNPQ